MTSLPSRRAATRWRVAAAVVAAALGLGAALGATGPAGATGVAASATTPTPSPSTPSGVIDLTASPFGGGVLRADRALTVSLTLDNDTASALGATSVTLELGSTPLADRASVSAWLAGEASNAALTTVGQGTLDPVGAQAEGRTSILVAPGDPTLATLGPGVYPLRATAATPTGAVTSTSVVTVPRDGSRAETALVVPITAGPLTAGLLSSTELAALTASDGELTAQLDAVAGTPALLAIDPAIPAAIRVLGTSAPSTAIAWLQRLDDLPNSRFALQFGDADIAAQLQAGQTRPLQPTSLGAYLKAVDFPAGSSTPTPSATEAGLPSTAELLDVGGIPNVYWPASGTATPAVVNALSTLGTPDQPAQTLVPSTSTAAGAEAMTVPARASAGDAALLVYDGDISAALGEASRTDDTALRGAPLAAASGYLFFASAEANGRPLLLAIDRTSARTSAGLGATVAAVEASSQITLVPYARLNDSEPEPATIVETAPEDARVAAASALLAGDEQVEPFATVLTDPSLLTGPERAETLQLLGNGWRGHPTEWDAALTAHETRTAKTLGSVEILEPSPVSLAGSGAPLGVWVRNDLAYAVELTLDVTPKDPRLVVQRTTTFTAPAESNTRVKVPVEARVGNGEVTISLRLLSPTGVSIGPERAMDVTVRAEWEGVGIATLSTIAGALLVFGVIRTVLRRRRVRAARGEPEDPGIPRD